MQSLIEQADVVIDRETIDRELDGILSIIKNHKKVCYNSVVTGSGLAETRMLACDAVYWRSIT